MRWFKRDFDLLENFTLTGMEENEAQLRSITEYLYGTSGNDSITTQGPGGYFIRTYDGHDRVDARASTAPGEVELGAGRDIFYGGSSTDVVSGGSGRDKIFGGDGGDILSGGYGRDVIRGGKGNDIISGRDIEGFFSTSDGSNQQALANERDNPDALYGGQGNDKIFLSPSDVRVFGGQGEDQFEFFFKETADGSGVFEGGAVQDFEVGEDSIKLVGASAGGDLQVNGSAVIYTDADGDRYEIDVFADGVITLDDFAF